MAALWMALGQCQRLRPLVSSAGRLGGQCRFGSTEGPWLYRKPKEVFNRKKHFNEVLIMADRRKLLETLQDVLDKPQGNYPKAFWEILAKRCIKSIHLLNPLELSIAARAFDVHEPKIRRDLDIFPSLAAEVRNAQHVPGLALIILAEVLPKRLKVSKEEGAELMRHLARRAADVMWEIPAGHAVRFVKALSDAGVREPALCGRVGSKLRMRLELEEQTPYSTELTAKDLGLAAAAFAAQGHRDLELFRCLARSAAVGLHGNPEGLEDAEQSAWQVLESLDTLGIEELEEAEPLRRALKFKASEAYDHGHAPPSREDRPSPL